MIKEKNFLLYLERTMLIREIAMPVYLIWKKHSAKYITLAKILSFPSQMRHCFL